MCFEIWSKLDKSFVSEVSSSEWPKLKHDRNEETNDSARTCKTRADFEVSGAYYKRPLLNFSGLSTPYSLYAV